MRKAIIGIFLLVLIAGGIFGWMILKKRMSTRYSSEPFTQLLREKPFFYVEFLGMGQVWDRFKESNYYRTLNDNKLVKNMVASDGWTQFKESLRETEKSLGFSINEENLKSLFGNDFALVLLPPAQEEKGGVKSDNRQDDRSNNLLSHNNLTPDFVLFFRLNAKAQLGSMAIKLNSWLKNDSSYSTQEYRGHTLYLVSNEPSVYPHINVLSENRLLVVSNRTSYLKYAIDRLEDGKGVCFSKLLSRLPEKYNMLAYVNNSLYQRWFNRMIESLGSGLESPSQEKWREITAGFSNEMACYGTLTDGLFELKGRDEIVDPKGLLGSILCREPEDANFAGLMPGNAFFCWWTNTVDFPKIRKLVDVIVTQDMTVKAAYDKFFGKIEAERGIDVEKLLSSLGPRLGLVLMNPTTDAPITLPGVLSFLEVRDRTYIEKVITKVLKEPGNREFKLPLAFGFKELRKGKLVLHYVPTPIFLTPGYMFIDSYVVSGIRLSDFEAVMNLADTNNNGSISRNDRFRDVIPARKVNSFAFLDMDGLIKTVRDLVDRYPIIKVKWTEEDEENFEGLLGLLEGIKGMGFIAYWQDPEIKFAYRILLRDTGKKRPGVTASSASSDNPAVGGAK